MAIWMYGHRRQMATKAQADAKNQQQKGKLVHFGFFGIVTSYSANCGFAKWKCAEFYVNTD